MLWTLVQIVEALSDGNTVSGSQFNNPSSMLPPRQQPRPGGGGLQTSLTLVSADACGSPNLERDSNSDQVHDSLSESASSRETWPTSEALIGKKLEKEKERENGSADHFVVRHFSSSDKMSLRDVARERLDIVAERMHNLPDKYLDKFKNELRTFLEGLGDSQQREEFLFLQKLVQSRGDLTEKTLTMAHRVQLEILVSIKTGIQAFLHPSVSLSQASLIEIFLYKRCRNIACVSYAQREMVSATFACVQSATSFILRLAHAAGLGAIYVLIGLILTVLFEMG